MVKHWTKDESAQAMQHVTQEAVRTSQAVSLNIFIQQSESIGQQGKPYLKASGSEIVYSATYKQNYNKKVNK